MLQGEYHDDLRFKYDFNVKSSDIPNTPCTVYEYCCDFFSPGRCTAI